MTPWLAWAPRFVRSVGHAARGIAVAWRSGAHFRFEVVAAGAALTLAAVLGTGFVAVALASALVLVAEALNTAVEAVVDRLSPDVHPVARAAKDCAAGAVLIAAIAAVAVGVAALGPALLTRWMGGA